jgi:hypothetical protein
LQPTLWHHARIEASGGIGLSAPTPYPAIARLTLGFRWLKMGAYWFSFTPPPELIITGVHYDRLDMPNRL